MVPSMLTEHQLASLSLKAPFKTLLTSIQKARLKLDRTKVTTKMMNPIRELAINPREEVAKREDTRAWRMITLKATEEEILKTLKKDHPATREDQRMRKSSNNYSRFVIITTKSTTKEERLLTPKLFVSLEITTSQLKMQMT